MAAIQTSLSALWRRPTVQAETGLGRSTIYRRIKQGIFPKPVNLGGDRVGWPAFEIEAINKARIAGATDEEIKALVAKLEAARGKEAA